MTRLITRFRTEMGTATVRTTSSKSHSGFRLRIYPRRRSLTRSMRRAAALGHATYISDDLTFHSVDRGRAMNGAATFAYSGLGAFYDFWTKTSGA